MRPLARVAGERPRMPTQESRESARIAQCMTASLLRRTPRNSQPSGLSIPDIGLRTPDGQSGTDDSSTSLGEEIYTSPPPCTRHRRSTADMPQVQFFSLSEYR